MYLAILSSLVMSKGVGFDFCRCNRGFFFSISFLKKASRSTFWALLSRSSSVKSVVSAIVFADVSDVPSSVTITFGTSKSAIEIYKGWDLYLLYLLWNGHYYKVSWSLTTIQPNYLECCNWFFSGKLSSKIDISIYIDIFVVIIFEQQNSTHYNDFIWKNV